MRPDEPEEGQEPGESAPGDESSSPEDGAGEPPAPSTWAGRSRAESAEDEAEGDVGDEPPAPAGTGLTAEFDAIQAQLARELAGITDVPPASSASPPGAAGSAEGAPDTEANTDVAADDEAAEEEPAEDEAEPAEPVPDASDDALAALRARTAGKSNWEPAPSPEEEALIAVAQTEVKPPPAKKSGQAKPAVKRPEDPAKSPKAKPIWARFLAASLIIVSSMAAAFSVSALVLVADLAERLGGIHIGHGGLDDVEGGDPQTILFLGSDIRPTDDTGRSDTTLLLRVDPEKDSMNLLSIPRDLKVTIPGVGIDKFNAAYSYGGPKLTLRVVKQLTGLDVNHVVNINFTGFADAVNSIECVFIDVDRRYYVPEGSTYSAIDPPIEAGYQRLCGLKALQYVRYRLEDNDLVRAARQQDFVREARQKIDPKRLLFDAGYRFDLLDVFKEYTTSDESLRSTDEVLDLMKTFLGAHDANLNEVHFPAILGETYVTAGNDAIKRAVVQFLGDAPTPPAGESSSGDGDQGAEKSDDNSADGKPNGGDNSGGGSDGGGEPDVAIEDVTSQTTPFANQISKVKTRGGDSMIHFPIYYPTVLAPGSVVTRDTRAFPIDGPKEYRGYKFVAVVPGKGGGLTKEFYGVSGTNWNDPPILENPTETREIDGRDYLLFYDGDRLRLVGWKEKSESYWVNNTLLQTLDMGQMLEIAQSMRELTD